MKKSLLLMNTLLLFNTIQPVFGVGLGRFTSFLRNYKVHSLMPTRAHLPSWPGSVTQPSSTRSFTPSRAYATTPSSRFSLFQRVATWFKKEQIPVTPIPTITAHKQEPMFDLIKDGCCAGGPEKLKTFLKRYPEKAKILAQEALVLLQSNNLFSILSKNSMYDLSTELINADPEIAEIFTPIIKDTNFIYDAAMLQNGDAPLKLAKKIITISDNAEILFIERCKKNPKHENLTLASKLIKSSSFAKKFIAILPEIFKDLVKEYEGTEILKTLINKQTNTKELITTLINKHFETFIQNSNNASVLIQLDIDDFIPTIENYSDAISKNKHFLTIIVRLHPSPKKLINIIIKNFNTIIGDIINQDLDFLLFLHEKFPELKETILSTMYNYLTAHIQHIKINQLIDILNYSENYDEKLLTLILNHRFTDIIVYAKFGLHTIVSIVKRLLEKNLNIIIPVICKHINLIYTNPDLYAVIKNTCAQYPALKKALQEHVMNRDLHTINPKITMDFIKRNPEAKNAIKLKLYNARPSVWKILATHMYNRTEEDPVAPRSGQLSSTEIHAKHTAQTIVDNKFINQYYSDVDLSTMVNDVVNLEKKFENTHYTFVHGQKWSHFLPEQWFTWLWQLRNKKGASNFIFAHIKPIVNNHNQQSLRKSLIKNGRLLFNERNERDHLLFLNGPFFGNSTNLGSNTAAYVAANDNVSTTILKLEQAFLCNNIASAYTHFKKELEELEAEYNTLSNHGVVLFFAVPKNKIKDYVYVAASGGVKRTVKIKGKFFNSNTSNIRTILDTLKNNPTNIENPDTIEYCLAMTADAGLNPDSDIVVRPVLGINYDKWLAFNKKQLELFRKIKQYILDNNL